jgi:ABC-2 type transport system ATP-binding protein
MARGRLVKAGTVEEMRGGRSLDDVFVELVGAEVGGLEGLAWLES